MATGKYYAWTSIVWVDKNGKRQTAQPGEVVSAKALNISEDQFDELIEARAARLQKYPDIPETWLGSPRDFMLMQRRKELEALDAGLDDDELALEAGQLADDVVDSE